MRQMGCATVMMNTIYFVSFGFIYKGRVLGEEAKKKIKKKKNLDVLTEFWGLNVIG